MIEYYCLTCGESVEPGEKKCGYCGSNKIDKMEIEEEKEGR